MQRELLEVRVVEPIFNLKTVIFLNLKTIKKKKRKGEVREKVTFAVTPSDVIFQTFQSPYFSRNFF